MNTDRILEAFDELGAAQNNTERVPPFQTLRNEVTALLAAYEEAVAENERLREELTEEKSWHQKTAHGFASCFLETVDELSSEQTAYGEAVECLKAVLNPPTDGGSHEHYIEKCDEARAFLAKQGHR